MSEMSTTAYKDLMLRFAKELDDVGVTESLIKCAHDSFKRTPNLAGYSRDENVRKFHYRHDGYLIEAIQTVKLTVKKCN
jgi:hypothetical protein